MPTRCVSRDGALRIQDQLFIKFFFRGFIDLSFELSLLPPLAMKKMMMMIILGFHFPRQLTVEIFFGS